MARATTKTLTGQVLVTQDVARLLGVSPSAVIKMTNENKLPCAKTPGGIRVFLAHEVERVRRRREAKR